MTAALLVLLVACEAPETEVYSSTGYVRVAIDTAVEGIAPADVASVRVGNVLALDLRAGDVLNVLIQGAPQPGPARIAVTPVDGEAVLLDAVIEFAPPLDPAFDRVVAFGASLTQGVMDAVATFDGTLDSPALVVARVLGAYMPQPQLVPGLFLPLGLEDVGDAPGCRSPNVVAHITGGMAETLPKLARPDGSGFGYEIGRVDPLITARNVAAGNYQLDDTVHGPDDSEIVQIFLGHLAFDPFGTFGEPPSLTQLDAIEALDPTLIFTTDMLGNDALGTGGNMTSPEQIAADLAILVPRLAATGAHVFLGDMPDVTILPGRIGAPDPNTSANIVLYNEALQAEADRFENVHVVPLFDATAEVATDGLLIGDETLHIGMRGGLLSFDGLHFSATGYGLVAQAFATSISEELGVELPPVNMPSILAASPHSPAAIRAAGREPDDCVPGG